MEHALSVKSSTHTVPLNNWAACLCECWLPGWIGLGRTPGRRADRPGTRQGPSSAHTYTQNTIHIPTHSTQFTYLHTVHSTHTYTQYTYLHTVHSTHTYTQYAYLHTLHIPTYSTVHIPTHSTHTCTQYTYLYRTQYIYLHTVHIPTNSTHT